MQDNLPTSPNFRFFHGPIIPRFDPTESNMSSDSDSSFVTEEDTSGNPLPQEIIEIRKRNKKLEHKLTSGIKNLKSSEISSYSEGTVNLLQTNPDDLCSLSINSKLQESGNLQSILSKILKLQSELKNAEKILKSTEQDIYNEESQNISLKLTLKQSELIKIQEKSIDCGCRIL